MVSIVVPTHNRARTLEGAVASLLAQTHAAIEVIVVDDGSNDDTYATMVRLADADRRLRCLRNDLAAGPSAARNRGISCATGEYLSFCDDDDRWLPGTAATALRYLDANPDVGVVSGWHEVVHPDHTVLYRGALRHRPEDLLWHNFLGIPFAVVRRSSFPSDIRFDENMKGAEDWDLWLRCAEERPVRTCPEPMYRYVQHHGPRVTKGRQVVATNRSMVAKHGTKMSAHCRDFHDGYIQMFEVAPERGRGRAALQAFGRKDIVASGILASMSVAHRIGVRRQDPALSARVLLTLIHRLG
jgi:glycosyltransferase involved in cell wall biosynthesis